MVVAIAY